MKNKHSVLQLQLHLFMNSCLNLNLVGTKTLNNPLMRIIFTPFDWCDCSGL